MILLSDNKTMITVRDIDDSGSLKIIDLVNRDIIKLETLEVTNLLIRSIAVSADEKLLFVSVDYPNPFNKCEIICYDLETKT